MRLRACLAALVVAGALLACGDSGAEGPASQTPAAPTGSAGDWLDTGNHPIHPLRAALAQRRSGDLDAIRRSGFLRVLTSYNNTSYFITDDQQRGLEFELQRERARARSSAG